ncbi:unnamed protein product [Boreogadus saida]
MAPPEDILRPQVLHLLTALDRLREPLLPMVTARFGLMSNYVVSFGQDSWHRDGSLMCTTAVALPRRLKPPLEGFWFWEAPK